MAAFLIDYENVNAKNGLDGAEYLKASDKLIIFYSQCCSKIRTDYMDIIRRSGCEFGIHKLLKTGKNGLDFYIASECGILAQKGETQIAIISNDKGFEAVTDFFKTREAEDGSTAEVVTAPNIERGLLALHDFNDKKRREQIQKNVNMLDISAEYEKYQAQMRFHKKVEQALKGTKYESMTERVLELVGEQTRTDRKVIYTGALHCFGRKQGTEVYRLVSLDTNLYERQGKAISNFELTLPEYTGELAQEITKDPYNFDFVAVNRNYSERELKDALTEKVMKLLLEMGKEQCFSKICSK